MKKIIAILLALGLIFAGIYFWKMRPSTHDEEDESYWDYEEEVAEEYSGAKTSLTFDLADFNAVSVSSAFDVRVGAGEYAVTASVPDYLAEYVLAEVRDSTLYISLQKHPRKLRQTALSASVTLPVLRFLKASGAADVVAELPLADTLMVECSGASDISVKGEGCDVLSVQVSGASDADLSRYDARIVNAYASGASDCRLSVRDSLTASASGASTILYSAPKSATITPTLSGSSTLRPK